MAAAAESRGYVRIRSVDPFAAPIIQTNYLVEGLDCRVVVAGMKLARRLLASTPLSQYYAYEDFPGPKVQSDDEFLAAASSWEKPIRATWTGTGSSR